MGSLHGGLGGKRQRQASSGGHISSVVVWHLEETSLRRLFGEKAARRWHIRVPQAFGTPNGGRTHEHQDM